MTSTTVRSLLAAWAATILAAAPLLAGDAIFSDGFESGDASAWSLSVGGPPTAFRFTDLDLRDPHLFVEVVIGIPLCLDPTDDPLPVVGFSFNQTLEDQLTMDGDGDGLLDTSLLTVFLPLDLSATGRPIEVAGGLCTAPLATTTCTEDPSAATLATTYDAIDPGVCLETVPGTTSGYVPGVTEPPEPCFVTAAESLTVPFGGIEITLVDAQVAATFAGDPPDQLIFGLLRGFLREADADLLLLPAEFPLVGGQPLSTLLPGGTGNCAAGDDRDQHLGESGWWFYLNFTADRVLLLPP